MKFDIPYQMQHLMSYRATLSEPEQIGPVAEGLRLNIYVTGGEFEGPRMKGKIRAVGADWLTIRTDGIGVLDVRATLETDDGALIYSHYTGMGDTGPNGYQDFIEGKPPPPEGIPIKCRPIFQTSHPGYIWLNRLFSVSIGRAFLDKSEVRFDVFSVT